MRLGFWLLASRAGAGEARRPPSGGRSGECKGATEPYPAAARSTVQARSVTHFDGLPCASMGTVVLPW